MIAERADFPADIGKVREFVLKVIGLKVGQSEPLGEKDRARLNLDASGTRVEFKAADGKDLGVFTVGRKYFKREVENPDKAIADGRFVALPGEAGTAYLVADPLTPGGGEERRMDRPHRLPGGEGEDPGGALSGRGRLAHRARRRQRRMEAGRRQAGRKARHFKGQRRLLFAAAARAGGRRAQGRRPTRDWTSRSWSTPPRSTGSPTRSRSASWPARTTTSALPRVEHPSPTQGRRARRTRRRARRCSRSTFC